MELNPWTEAVRNHKHKVLEPLSTIPPMGAGILQSEMLAFICACIEQEVERVVESGRKLGYSTETLAVCLPDCEILSTDRSPIKEEDERFAAYDNVTLFRGDGMQFIPSHISGRTAVLMDGPKGWNALKVFLEVRDRVVFSGIHDLNKGNECRAELEVNEEIWFTDDEQYVLEYGYLEDEWWPLGGYNSRDSMVAESFCLGLMKGGEW